MNHRDHLPKTSPVNDRNVLAEFARTHGFCQACGADYRVLQTHHILGGRAGRSDEPCNLLRVCGWPCHLLAEQLDVREEGWTPSGRKLLLPKITDAVAIKMKIRAGELVRPILLNHPGSIELVTSPEWDRLTVLNLRPLPDAVEIPNFFQRLWKLNRPELCG